MMASDHLHRLPAILVGDYNGSGTVEQGDLDLVLLNWGRAGVPNGWVDDLPLSGIDQTELDVVLLNWGSSGLATGASVPEPLTAGLVMVVVAAQISFRRRA